MFFRSHAVYILVFILCANQYARSEPTAETLTDSNVTSNTVSPHSSEMPSLRINNPERISGKSCSNYFLKILGAIGIGGGTSALGYDLYSDWNLPPSGENEPGGNAPILSQLDPELKATLPCSGRKACGPTSAAMGLGWLNEHGYKNILGPQADKDALLNLTKELSMLMRNDGNRGVSIDEFISGIKRVFSRRDYPVPTVDYTGWTDRPNGKQIQKENITPPELNDVLKQLATKKTVVWISLRLSNGGSHLVLMTGYNRIKHFGEDDLELLIRDPWKETPESLSETDRWKLRRLGTNETISVGGSTLSGKDQYEVTMPNGKRGILKGLITLTPSE